MWANYVAAPSEATDGHRLDERIAENERRYHAEGRAALSGDKHTVEWPITEFADAQLVDKVPATSPPAVQGLGPRFVAVTLGGKRHFFAGMPGGDTAEEFHASLLAATESRPPQPPQDRPDR